MTDKELQDKYLGKRIRVSFKDDTVTGICKFIGHNPYLPSWELQVTIDRFPISNVDETKIELLTDKSKDLRTI
jgi:hypothetical protein